MEVKINMNKNDELAVCLLGTYVPQELFDDIQKRSKIKAAGSPVIMQRNIFRSMNEVCDDITVFSYPPVAMFPKGIIVNKRQVVTINRDNTNHVFFMINIPILKQAMLFFSFLFSLILWSHNKKQKKKIVFLYADFLEYCIPALILRRVCGYKTVLFLTEMPGYAHYKKGRRGIIDLIKITYEHFKSELYEKYDGYIFVTKHMSDKVKLKHKPYTVIEGFVENSIQSHSMILKKSDEPKVAMYAGSLGAAYNIKMLVDAFQMTKGQYELWIFGDGLDAEYVKEAASKDTRIKYFGRVPQQQVLDAERRADLLLHVKTAEDEHSKYAFSSKILEYMMTGIPVLTTVVAGIPDEYYEHLYIIDETTTAGISKALINTLSLEPKERFEKGKSAQRFVVENKCFTVQGEKMLRLMREIV